MNEKEKAKELVDKFYEDLPQWVNGQDAQQCALICVDEIKKSLTSNWYAIENLDSQLSYWNDVEKEIQIIHL